MFGRFSGMSLVVGMFQESTAQRLLEDAHELVALCSH